MKKLAILSAVAAFGVLGFVGPASAAGAVDLEDNQTVLVDVMCEPGTADGAIDMYVNAIIRGGGPKFQIPVFDCITNVVQSHSPGGGAPATDSLSGGTEGVCNGANVGDTLPAEYTIQSTCANVPATANTIGVQGILEIQFDTPAAL